MSISQWFLFAVFFSLAFHPTSAQAQEKPRSFQVGKAEVYPLLDVARDMPTDLFSGASPEAIKALAPEGKAPAGIRGFVILMDKKVILVDTGLGSQEKPRSLLLESLAQVGLKPENVTQVVLTHLHPDHVGGLLRDGKIAFPQAEVFVGMTEKAFWYSDAALGGNPAKKDNFVLARKILDIYGDKVKTFSFGQEIIPGLTTVDAIGHTPGHTAFLLESDGKRLLFWGDTVHAAALQFPNPNISASYDMDVPKAVETRKRLMKLAADENLPVAGAHMPEPGLGRVSRQGEGFTLQPF